jgi:hypothetical protein
MSAFFVRAESRSGQVSLAAATLASVTAKVGGQSGAAEFEKVFLLILAAPLSIGAQDDPSFSL